MQPTDIRNPDYFHKVVDCQWACPAHTPGSGIHPADRRWALFRYLVNWKSNVFPGVLGRTCDAVLQPACRRGRVEEEQSARSRSRSRSAASSGSRLTSRTTSPAAGPCGAQERPTRIACVGAGPASLTVAHDLAPLGYDVTVVFDRDARAGGTSPVADSPLPPARRSHRRGDRLRAEARRRFPRRRRDLVDERPAPRDSTRSSSVRARRAGATSNCRAARKAQPTSKSGSTGCPRYRSGTSRRSASASSCWAEATPRWTAAATKRLGGEDVKVIVRSGFEEMKASPWEKKAAVHEGIPILNYLVPKAFLHTAGKLTGMSFEGQSRLR